LKSRWRSPYILVYTDPLLTYLLVSVPSILTSRYVSFLLVVFLKVILWFYAFVHLNMPSWHLTDFNTSSGPETQCHDFHLSEFLVRKTSIPGLIKSGITGYRVVDFPLILACFNRPQLVQSCPFTKLLVAGSSYNLLNIKNMSQTITSISNSTKIWKKHCKLEHPCLIT